jgi:hypothetical protein
LFGTSLYRSMCDLMGSHAAKWALFSAEGNNAARHLLPFLVRSIALLPSAGLSVSSSFRSRALSIPCPLPLLGSNHSAPPPVSVARAEIRGHGGRHGQVRYTGLRGHAQGVRRQPWQVRRATAFHPVIPRCVHAAPFLPLLPRIGISWWLMMGSCGGLCVGLVSLQIASRGLRQRARSSRGRSLGWVRARRAAGRAGAAATQPRCPDQARLFFLNTQKICVSL